MNRTRQRVGIVAASDELRGAEAKLLELPDSAFRSTWHEMSVEQRSALPDDLRARGFDRYKKLTNYVDKSITRLQREQNPEPEQHVATDVANARRIAEHFGDSLAYTSAGWLAWDGRRWSLDGVAATGMAAGLGALILTEAAETMRRSAAESDSARRRQGAELAEELAKWSRQSEGAHRIEAALSLARSKLQRPVEDFDADPFLLNVQNGVLNLRTGKLLPHAPALRLTKLAGCAFDPAAECPTWLRFLDDVFLRDAELVAFVQRLCGYFLTGSTRDHVLPIAHGVGANGKTTFMRGLEAVRTLARKHPDVITEGGLRWEIFNEEKNGLKESGAILRRGRKILIDADRYFLWLYNQNQVP